MQFTPSFQVALAGIEFECVIIFPASVDRFRAGLGSDLGSFREWS